jgi:LysM repeat protein
MLVALATMLPIQSAFASSCQAAYIVKSRDTLGKIAKTYNVNLDDLNKTNHLYYPYHTIYVGQKLCIPAKGNGLTGIPYYAALPAAN